MIESFEPFECMATVAWLHVVWCSSSKGVWATRTDVTVHRLDSIMARASAYYNDYNTKVVKLVSIV
jgi:hypothetical protein